MLEWDVVLPPLVALPLLVPLVVLLPDTFVASNGSNELLPPSPERERIHELPGGLSALWRLCRCKRRHHER